MNKQILVVDDNAPIRRLVRIAIESRPGLAVCGEAVDGVDALEKGGLLKPDLIVMDLLMPRMNGLEAAVALRRIVPQAPIIMFTFHQDAISGHQVNEAGISSVFSKTNRLSALLDEIERLTNGTAAHGCSSA